MAITSFDKNNLTILRAELTKRLKDIEKDLGIGIKLGNCKFLDKSATFQLEIGVVGSDGHVETKEAAAFRMLATMYGFKPTDLGRTFVTPNGEFRITGLNTRAGKHPILATDVRTGKGYKFPETVSKFLK